MGLTAFEIHITTVLNDTKQEKEFVEFCKNNEAKPLVIHLERGEFVNQPMLSKTIQAGDLQEALKLANTYKAKLTHEEFPVIRVKIEVPATDFSLFENVNPEFEHYFEWHGKVELGNRPQLEEICLKHKVHLSRNALKDEPHLRFITLREFGGEDQFKNRITVLKSDLAAGGSEIRKEESEYCIYDDKKALDNGWLSPK